MRLPLYVIIALLLAVDFTGSACANQSSAQKQGSAEAYEALMAEIKQIQAGARSQADMIEKAEVVAGKIREFLGEYPDSEEATEARFQLGVLHSSLMQHAEAIPLLRSYVDQQQPGGDEKYGYAIFFLAQAYMNTDQFDEAREHYTDFINNYPMMNPQYRQIAQSSLQDMDTLKKLAIGSEPIPFEVKDLTGKVISPEKYKGKVVLLDFWATWCKPCIHEMPNVIDLYKKYNEKGFEIIGISLDRDRSALTRYIDQYSIKWPQFYDGKFWSNDIAVLYKVRSIPATYLLDRQGKIRYKSLRGKDLEKAVTKLLNET